MENKPESVQLKKGVIFILLSALSFSIMALFVKFAAKTVSADKIIAFRFGISFIYILIVLSIRKSFNKDISLKTSHIYMHVFRALFSILGMVLLYTSLNYIPLVDANLLNMTSALFIPIIGALILKSKVNNKHWIAIAVGFIGVGFILKPGNELINFYSFLALLSGLCVAISLILLREISLYDSHHVCMFYMFFITFLISLTYAAFTWQPIDLKTLLFLIAAGVFGSFYQDFMTRASFYAPAKIVSSLLYTTLIFTIFFDWFFINHIPGFVTFIGIILVVLSSILTVYAARAPKEISLEK